jgi:NTE family protein
VIPTRFRTDRRASFSLAEGFLAIALLLLSSPVTGAGTGSLLDQPDQDPEPAAPRIGLALGSGGAAGLAHIAILKTFDELDQQPSRIAGSSIGAIIGALYAAGLSGAEIEALFAEFSGSGLDLLTDLARGENGIELTEMIDLGLDDGGLVDPEPFFDYLREHTSARAFSDLRIPLVVVATRYFSGESVAFEEGDLFQALRASMAVPGLVQPVIRDGELLVDGGISNPLPWDRLGDDLDYIVAVDVTGQRESTDPESVPANELLFKTFELMQQSIVRERLKTNPPDLYLRPEIDRVRLLHFHRIDTILEQAAPAAERLRQFLDNPSSPPARPGH